MANVVTFSITKELHDILRARAGDNRRTVSAEVRELLYKALGTEQTEKVRKKGGLK